MSTRRAAPHRDHIVEQLEARRLLSAILYVDLNAPGPTHDGSSWTSAYLDPQAALAAVAGDQIRVADGTYFPGAVSTDSFALKNGVTLLGGYAGYGAANPDARDVVAFPTSLSGDIGVAGEMSDNSFHVVIATNVDSTSILDGFTITAGDADDYQSDNSNEYGGGMYISSASPTIRGCTFSQNFAYFGGAIYGDASSPTLVNCTLTNNTAARSGGAMEDTSSPQLIGCTISYNTCTGYEGGGGIYTADAVITGCTFNQNTAQHGGGGAISNHDMSLITNCMFSGNSASEGGAIYNGTSAGGTVSGCTFEFNSASDDQGVGGGGAVYNLHASTTFDQCLFYMNSSNDGGAVFSKDCTRGFTPTFNQCTFSYNTAGTGGAISGKSSTFTANRCGFDHNSVTGWGGAIGGFIVEPNLNDCTFTANSSSGGGAIGGGYAAPGEVSGCTFENNTSSGDGGAVGGYLGATDALGFTNCTFRGNAAAGNGGAMFVPDVSPSIAGCTFTANSAHLGGAMYLDHTSPTIDRCTFNGNKAYSGGGIYLDQPSYGMPQITNCSAVGNTAYTGGAIYAAPTSSLNLVNSTIDGNQAAVGGGIFADTSTLAISNCIVWANLAFPGAQIFQKNSSTTIQYSDVQNGNAGSGNLNLTPHFVREPVAGPDSLWGTADDDYGDVRLQITSPCIDAGSNTLVPPGINLDLANNPRIVDVPGIHDPGAIVDMGAYEYFVPLIAGGGVFAYDAPKQSISIRFNQSLLPEAVHASDLILKNLTTGQTIGATAANFVYDPMTSVAVWTFPFALPSGNYRATLPAGSVSDAGGNPLAADYSFDFFFLAADANHDRKVDVADLGILASNWQGSGKTFSQGDFNYDGKVDVTDLSILATNWQQGLPPPPASGFVSFIKSERLTSSRAIDLVQL